MHYLETAVDLSPTVSSQARVRRRARADCIAPSTATPHFSPPRAMRCACQHCGAHTIATVGYKVAGSCPNCGSYELAPVLD